MSRTSKSNKNTVKRHNRTSIGTKYSKDKTRINVDAHLSRQYEVFKTTREGLQVDKV